MSQAKEKFLKDYTQPDYSVNNINLNVDLYEDHALINASMDLQKNIGATHDRLCLDGEDIELLAILINGEPLTEKDYKQTSTNLILSNMPQDFNLKITTKIYPDKNTALQGLYRSGGMFCTQCEAEGFRRITYYLDRPDVMSTFTTRLTADKEKYPILLSNGNKIDSGVLDSGRHFAKWHDPFKKPSYLFALVAGNLEVIKDSFITRSGRNILLELYTEFGKIDQCQYALDSLKRAMRWDEERFGCEYDLDIYMIVAVSDFNMGAMENKGLNLFNTKYVLAKPESATDNDFLKLEAVIGHEYFHNWTGNRITCRDWFQLSLKEGLTVFRDQEFTSDLNNRSIKRIADTKLIRGIQFTEDASPMAHPIRPESYVEINNFYTTTVYEKGAEIIRMILTLLGKNGFRKGMDLYFSRHDGQAVTCDDFLKAMADANNISLDKFKLWYSQAGTPTIIVNDKYDEKLQQYTLNIKQTCPSTSGQKIKDPFHIPIKLGLVASNGEDITLVLKGSEKNNQTEIILNLYDQEQTFTFLEVKEKPIPSLLRDFSAPVKVDYKYSENELCFLFMHDNNDFNRWDAGQTLFKNFILTGVNDLLKNKTLKVSEQLINAFTFNLTSETLDAGLIAEAISIPTAKMIAEDMPTIWVDQLLEARSFLVRTLAEKLEIQFLACYKKNEQEITYELNQKDIGMRALKNACLSYLLELDKPSYIELAKKQFYEANNMTDQFGAVEALNKVTHITRQEVLDDFYDKWQHHELVMNKWLAIQAQSQATNTLSQVKNLTNHPAFNIKMPNNVYALLLTFGINMKYFHAKDGSGYSFVKDKVIELSFLNPIVAARLVRYLIDWKRYDKTRSLAMKQALEDIIKVPDLCKDVNEIVAKTLA